MKEPMKSYTKQLHARIKTLEVILSHLILELSDQDEFLLSIITRNSLDYAKLPVPDDTMDLGLDVYIEHYLRHLHYLKAGGGTEHQTL